MQKTSFELDIYVSIGPSCNLRHADGIEILGGREEELQQLTERLEKTAARYRNGN